MAKYSINEQFYVPFNQFVIRCPILPIETLGSSFENKEHLLNLFSDNVVSEAIYLASPIVYSEMCKLLYSDCKFEKRERERLINTFAKYISRMSSRCTPFGLFAGCAVGNVGNNTSIIKGNLAQCHVRLDMDFVYRLYSDLIKLREFKDKIRYYPNTTLYRVGNTYRYIETILVGLDRQYRITSVEKNKYINKILRIAKQGVKRDDVISVLVSSNIEYKNAIDFVESLIDSQVLIPELNQSIVGSNFFDRLICLCQKVGYSQTDILVEIQRKIQKLNSTSSHLISEYSDIEQMVNKLAVKYDNNKLFQLDYAFNVSATLGGEVVSELTKILSFLNRFQRRGGNAVIDNFKTDFVNRYDAQEIPLMEALDPEVGIGYPSGIYSLNTSPLLENYKSVNNQSNDIILNPIEQWLYKKAVSAIETKSVLVLSDNDVKDVREDWSQFQLTFGVMFELLKKNNDYVIRFISTGGSSAANLLSRFVHINDDLYEIVDKIVDFEQNAVQNDACLSEIEHLPEGRIGNILSRPNMRNYKILYMSSPSDEENEISISDILISVKNDQIILRSKITGKQVIPYLTSAHNYLLRTMPAYKFLCDLQKSYSVIFSWGALEKMFTYRPRVMYRNHIISSASWSIFKEDFSKWSSTDSDEILLHTIDDWRNCKGIPQYTLLVDSDNKLFIDWRNIISIRALLSVIHNRQSIILEEFIGTNEKYAVSSSNNVEHFTNEIILPFYRKAK